MNAINATITLTKSNVFAYISQTVEEAEVFDPSNRSHYDKTEQYIRLDLPTLPKITEWLEDWVTTFNETAENNGCVLYSSACHGGGYIIEKLQPDEIKYPGYDFVDEDSIELTTEQYKDCPTMLKEEIDANVEPESESDDESDDEEEDDWMEIYSEKEVDGELEELKPYEGFHYYQCWGGGPSGGFITNDKGDIYKINRTWGEPFTVEPVKGKIEVMMRDNVKQLRIIE
jgi:hypothetical protein